MSRSAARVELVARPADLPAVEENGETLEDNARLKAHAVRAATGLSAVADDTGLEVDALGGLPGVRCRAATRGRRDRGAQHREAARASWGVATTVEPVSARSLSRRCSTVPSSSRRGTLEGTIAEAPRGEGGFGYDAVFLPDGGDGRRWPRWAAADKHEISHRGRALRELAGLLSRAPVGHRATVSGVPVPVHATGRARFAAWPRATAVKVVGTGPASTSCRRAGPAPSGTSPWAASARSRRRRSSRTRSNR